MAATTPLEHAEEFILDDADVVGIDCRVQQHPGQVGDLWAVPDARGLDQHAHVDVIIVDPDTQMELGRATGSENQHRRELVSRQLQVLAAFGIAAAAIQSDTQSDANHGKEP